MFTKEDFGHYLDQMLELEHGALKTYSEILRHVQDEELTSAFRMLVEAEKDHITRLQELQAIAGR